MGTPDTSTIIAGMGLAVYVYDDVKTGKQPFTTCLYGGMLIVILAGVAQLSPDLATGIAVLYLLTALFSIKLPAQKGK